MAAAERRYARALFEAAQERNRLDEVQRDLSDFVELFREFNACVEAYQHGRSTGHDPSAADAAAVARQESL